jgi:hypothetical protein
MIESVDRLRPEISRKLNSRMGLSRAYAALMVGGAFLLMSILLFEVSYREPVVARSEMNATVSGWTRSQTKYGSGRLFVWVDLADGHRVMVRQSGSKSPAVGQHIKIERLETKSGGVRYEWLE